MDDEYGGPWKPEYVGLPSFLRFAETNTFSSFATGVTEAYARHIPRPFQLIVMPSYRRPEDLSMESPDSMWLDAPPERPTPVWDGFSPIALFEVVYECFRYDGPGDMFRVYDVKGNFFVKDPRSPELLAARPRRWHDFTRADSDRHHKVLRRWAGEDEGYRTSLIYSPYDFHRTPDGRQREVHWNREKMTVEKRNAAYGLLQRQIAAGDVVLPYRDVPLKWGTLKHKRDPEAHARMVAKALAEMEASGIKFPPRPLYEQRIIHSILGEALAGASAEGQAGTSEARSDAGPKAGKAPRRTLRERIFGKPSQVSRHKNPF